MIKKEPSRLKILESIGSHFQKIYHWSSNIADNSEYISEYSNMAKGLIELLEENDTGSVNGYRDFKSLWERFIILYNRYDKIDNKRFGCNTVSFKNLNNFFIKLKNIYTNE